MTRRIPFRPALALLVLVATPAARACNPPGAYSSGSFSSFGPASPGVQRQQQSFAQAEREQARQRAIVLRRWQSEQMAYRQRAQKASARRQVAIAAIQARSSHRDREATPATALAANDRATTDDK